MMEVQHAHNRRVMTQSAKSSESSSDDWCTPPVVLDRVRAVMPIRLDPASSGDNPTNATVVLTPHNDGLLMDWHSLLKRFPRGGCTFVNPPFSQVGAWARKAAEEAAKGLPIFFLGASRVDARWYRSLLAIADAEIIWKSRIKFLDPETGCPPKDRKGNSTGATFPVTVFAFNVSRRQCEAKFSDVARVEVPR
jgi:phage N-6-adenine-methyltransferase